MQKRGSYLNQLTQLFYIIEYAQFKKDKSFRSLKFMILGEIKQILSLKFKLFRKKTTVLFRNCFIYLF